MLTEALLELLLNEQVEPRDVYIFPQKIHGHIRFNCDGIKQNNLSFDRSDWVKCFYYIQIVRISYRSKYLFEN